MLFVSMKACERQGLTYSFFYTQLDTSQGCTLVYNAYINKYRNSFAVRKAANVNKERHRIMMKLLQVRVKWGVQDTENSGYSSYLLNWSNWSFLSLNSAI